MLYSKVNTPIQRILILPRGLGPVGENRYVVLSLPDTDEVEIDQQEY